MNDLNKYDQPDPSDLRNELALIRKLTAECANPALQNQLLSTTAKLSEAYRRAAAQKNIYLHRQVIESQIIRPLCAMIAELLADQIGHGWEEAADTLLARFVGLIEYASNSGAQVRAISGRTHNDG